LLLGPPASFGKEDQFRNDVVPILKRRCLGCHNDKEQKGEFSLQTAASAFADGHIEAGQSASSRLIEVITPVDGKAEMPKNADPLSAVDIAAIRKWIDAGAEWPEQLKLTAPRVADLNWWSLRPLRRPTVPSSDEDLSTETRLRQRTPIDAFIGKKRKEQGLSAAPEADRAVLIRRLSFDLLGLPPTAEEVADFIQDEAPQAYERLVDRLLESKHYGERWARHWLDVVHYADTHGYDKDKLRPNAWPYRDYVIRSFNADKPYSRFVMEQIAGDVLWPHTLDGITATGFIAAGPWDYIGHAEVSESKIDGRIARHLDRDDMVTSTLNTFCSTTVQCARCHNHKFDPITQAHYYSLQAVFAALDRADRPYDADPQTSKHRAELKKRQAELMAEKVDLETQVETMAGKELLDIDAQLAQLNKEKQSTGVRPEFGYHSNIESKPDILKWFQVDLGESTLIQTVIYVGCHDDFNGIGHGFGFPPRYKIEVSDNADFQSSVSVLVDHTKIDVANPGTTPQSVKTPAGLKARYLRMTATKLAVRMNDYIFALAEITVLTTDGQNAAFGKKVTSLDSIEAPVRWQRKNLVDGYYLGVAASSDVISQIAKLKRQRAAVLDRALSEQLKAAIAKSREAIQLNNAQIKRLPPQGNVYAGTIYRGKGNFVGTAANGGKPREIHVLNRGNILQPLGRVAAGTIPVIPDVDWRFALPKSHGENDRRVALARWLVHRDNPLVWRSIVNRIWQYHFGRGIVDSPNDFGRMGQQPSHPDLLDWLAVEFRDGGQSMKKLHKLILTSSVYRQSSLHNKRNKEIDSGNVYLWRMNRRRITAEELRDAVLVVSGKLNRTMYGPGFRLFVLERPEHSPHYEYHKHNPDDPKSHRRSIYRFIVRSQPDPFMTTLDCADSSQSVAKRDETVTALQALSLLNNKFMLHMAKEFAKRIESEFEDPTERVERAFELVTGHRPERQQRDALVGYADKFGNENLCRLLFNLSEFVFVD
jgi:hypothetical protein